MCLHKCKTSYYSSKGRILGFKRKTLPVNNDVEVRVEFDMNKKIYFDSIPDFDIFEEEIIRTLNEIKKNNFVFIWKRYTGIFMDNDGRVYFGIKYSTRKSIGFNRDIMCSNESSSNRWYTRNNKVSWVL